MMETWLYNANCAESNNVASHQYEKKKNNKLLRISPCQSPYLDKEDRSQAFRFLTENTACDFHLTLNFSRHRLSG